MLAEQLKGTSSPFSTATLDGVEINAPKELAKTCKIQSHKVLEIRSTVIKHCWRIKIAEGSGNSIKYGNFFSLVIYCNVLGINHSQFQD